MPTKQHTPNPFWIGFWDGFSDIGSLEVFETRQRDDAANVYSYFAAVGQDIAGAMQQFDDTRLPISGR